MKVVDCHAHIFPPLEGASGFADAQTHCLYQQYAMHTHGNQPVRRARDQAIVRDRHLWDREDFSQAGGARDVHFRVGRFGRFEWEKDGERYYVQFLPPSLQEMHAPAAFMVAQMDHAGVDMAVLQDDHIYGHLAEYFAQAVAQYPGRFAGLASVDEAFAYTDAQVERLQHSVEKLGMRGLYFTTAGFFRNGFAEYYDQEAFRPFWKVVEDLRIPVFWAHFGGTPIGDYAAEMRRFLGWLEKHPAIPSVLVHGVPTRLFADEKGRIHFPEYLTRMMREFPVYAEVLYPIAWGRDTDYPYAQARQHLEQLCAWCGPGRLLWGSDMPNVERYCTYRQSLSYLREYCPFLSPEEMAQILGGNALALLG